MNSELPATGADQVGIPEVALDRHGLRLYHEGDAYYDALHADLAQAQQEIRWECYILASDEVGMPLLQTLMARSRAGCRVQLRIDAFGSHDVFDERLQQALTDSGIELSWCRRWSWRQPLTYHRRNHRKLVVIDQRCFYLGGYNLHRESSRRSVGEKRWRDTHLRVSGALVEDATRAFEAYGSPRRWWRRWRQRRTGLGYLLPNLGLRRRFLLYRLYRRRINAARQRVWVTTPYFVPPTPLQRVLVKAAKRGVDVRVLVPRRIDIELVQWASRAAYARLLRGGVRVFEYLPRMLHAKVLQVDADWATVGTANMDYRSLFINDELVLVLREPDACAALADQFVADLELAEEVNGSGWSRRPWLAWLAELIGWWARRWL